MSSIEIVEFIVLLILLAIAVVVFITASIVSNSLESVKNLKAFSKLLQEKEAVKEAVTEITAHQDTRESIEIEKARIQLEYEKLNLENYRKQLEEKSEPSHLAKDVGEFINEIFGGDNVE